MTVTPRQAAAVLRLRAGRRERRLALARGLTRLLTGGRTPAVRTGSAGSQRPEGHPQGR